MKFCFGDIVVVEESLIGVVVKSWVKNGQCIAHEVYVREYNCIVEYSEDQMSRYMVRHKYLSEEELQYQYSAVNPFN